MIIQAVRSTPVGLYVLIHGDVEDHVRQRAGASSKALEYTRWSDDHVGTAGDE
jgi:hypothetical protein